MRLALDGAVPPLAVGAVALLLLAWRRGYLRGRSVARVDAAIILAIVGLTAVLEWQMDRTLVYRHGPIRVWSGVIQSDQNSQQISDPYTFTHVIHGAVFYGLTRVTMPAAAIGTRLIMTTALESAWEAYENTDTVVNRYRAATISLGYYGDSVLNSVCDVVACLLGFVLAWKLPRQVTWTWIIAVEVLLALWIRDNLTLNIIMLIRPIDAIRRWQMGA